MSSERVPPHTPIARGIAVVLGLAGVALAGVALGCGRDAGRDTGHDSRSAGRVGRAGADSVWHAPGAQAGAGAVAAPTPGFTSAQGTPGAGPARPPAPAAVAARMAPPPPPALAARLGAEEQAAVRALPAGAGRELVAARCLTCHAATMIAQQHKDTAGWNKTVTQMVAWGAPVPADAKPVLVAYLAAHYPARAAGPPARQVP